MDFFDIGYLGLGNATQQKAYAMLTGHGIIQKLLAYSPVLAGTIPLAIDVEGSDLDIICQYNSAEEFTAHITVVFSHHTGFSIRTSVINGRESVVTNFSVDGFEIEIFGQNLSVTTQYAYRHMIIEYHILQQKGEAFRQQVIVLKQLGIKTEPAFAQLLGLTGNPYEALLDYKIY